MTLVGSNVASQAGGKLPCEHHLRPDHMIWQMSTILPLLEPVSVSQVDRVDQ